MPDLIPPQSPAPRGEISLTQLQPGQEGVIRGASLGEDETAMLRAMGLRLNARVKMCRLGEPCIVHLVAGGGCGCRIGLARPLADKVRVGPIEP
ncbi:MAG: ferrous iron transport protein A [Phycisphaerales bacterium]|nr:ferrous iron transport protein A [Phycisphaerales bacterium]